MIFATITDLSITFCCFNRCRYVWPWAKWSALSHDSYTCNLFPRTKAFPTRRLVEKNNFVASVVEAGDVMKKHCPEKCRPEDHKDWLYC